MKKYIIAGLSMAAMVFGQTASADVVVTQTAQAPAAYCFASNLSVGSSGEAVRQLQILLNKESPLQVATSGAGSPGNESTYFGPATQAAVVKFQLKYASSVLAPAGLSRGTGFVGTLTRNKLNDLSGCTHAEASAVSVSVATDKASYVQGEPMTITVTARNNSADTKTLNFNTGCQASYSIPTAGFTLSNLCTMTLTSVTLSPGVSKSWTFVRPASAEKLAVGTQTIRGSVLGYGSADAAITITALPTVSVTSPNGGEVWNTGASYFITWAYDTTSSYHSSDLYALKQAPACAAGTACPFALLAPFKIASGISGESYRWKVGTVQGATSIPTGDYKIEVCPAGSTEGCDTSDGSFTVK